MTDDVSCAVNAEPDTWAGPNVEDEATDIGLVGAVLRPARSDPHAINVKRLRDVAPIENAAFRNVTTSSSGKRRPVAACVEHWSTFRAATQPFWPIGEPLVSQ
jgi:hypothetical protein